MLVNFTLELQELKEIHKEDITELTEVMTGESMVNTIPLSTVHLLTFGHERLLSKHQQQFNSLTLES